MNCPRCTSLGELTLHSIAAVFTHDEIFLSFPISYLLQVLVRATRGRVSLNEIVHMNVGKKSEDKE